MKKYVLAAMLPVLALTFLGVFAGPAQAAGPLIVIDPGHSGTSLTTIDPETQIRDEEYNNGLENHNMWDVSLLLKAKLEAAGYRVLLTKDGPDDTVCKRDRADIANNNGAALAVSLHTSGHIFGQYGEIYVQRMDSYRENIYGQRVYFNLPDVAVLSQKFGQIFLTERRKIEGSSIVITVNTSWGGRGLAPGNIPIVELFSKVPWILLEAGVPQNSSDKDRYAQSAFNSIVACVPLDYVSPPIRIIAEQTDTHLAYTGSWGTGQSSGASRGSWGYANTSGASVTVKFTGTSLSWITVKSPNYGIAQVTLDSDAPLDVDLYSPDTKWQQKVWSATGLQDGAHTLTIAYTGDQEPRRGWGLCRGRCLRRAGQPDTSQPHPLPADRHPSLLHRLLGHRPEFRGFRGLLGICEHQRESSDGQVHRDLVQLDHGQEPQLRHRPSDPRQ